MNDLDSELICKIYLNERAGYDYNSGEYPITIVKMDNHHDYTTVDGVRYELAGGNSKEIIVPIESIETTQENTFYSNHIQAYKKYIQDGGILQTLPVQEITQNDMSMKEMIDDLENSNNDEDWKNSYYWTFQDRYHINYKELDRLIELYNNKDEYLDDPDQLEEILEFEEWVKEWYDEHLDEKTTYHLLDSNHRFQALKELGVQNVMVDID